MATCELKMKVRTLMITTAAVALVAAFPAGARAQDTAGTVPAPVVAATPTPPPTSGSRMVGGHVGAAVPMVSFHSVARRRRRRRTSSR